MEIWICCGKFDCQSDVANNHCDVVYRVGYTVFALFHQTRQFQSIVYNAFGELAVNCTAWGGTKWRHLCFNNVTLHHWTHWVRYEH